MKWKDGTGIQTDLSEGQRGSREQVITSGPALHSNWPTQLTDPWVGQYRYDSQRPQSQGWDESRTFRPHQLLQKEGSKVIVYCHNGQPKNLSYVMKTSFAVINVSLKTGKDQL